MPQRLADYLAFLQVVATIYFLAGELLLVLPCCFYVGLGLALKGLFHFHQMITRAVNWKFGKVIQGEFSNNTFTFPNLYCLNIIR